MSPSRTPTSGVRSAGFFKRLKTTELFPEESSAPLLPDDSATRDQAVYSDDEYPEVVAVKPAKMGFFDNLKGWDRSKKTRYLILLALSLSGDGW